MPLTLNFRKLPCPLKLLHAECIILDSPDTENKFKWHCRAVSVKTGRYNFEF